MEHETAIRVAIRRELLTAFEHHHERLRRTRRRVCAGAIAMLLVAGCAWIALVASSKPRPAPQVTAFDARPHPSVVPFAAAPAKPSKPVCRVTTVTTSPGIAQWLPSHNEVKVQVIDDAEFVLLLQERCASAGLIRIERGGIFSAKVLAACDEIPADARFQVR